MNRRNIFSILAAAPIGGAAMLLKPEPELTPDYDPKRTAILPPGTAGTLVHVTNDSAHFLIVKW